MSEFVRGMLIAAGVLLGVLLLIWVFNNTHVCIGCDSATATTQTDQRTYTERDYDRRGPPAGAPAGQRGHERADGCRAGFERHDGMCVAPMMQVDGPSPYNEPHAGCKLGEKRKKTIDLGNGVTRTIYQTCTTGVATN